MVKKQGIYKNIKITELRKMKILSENLRNLYKNEKTVDKCSKAK